MTGRRTPIRMIAAPWQLRRQNGMLAPARIGKPTRPALARQASFSAAATEDVILRSPCAP